MRIVLNKITQTLTKPNAPYVAGALIFAATAAFIGIPRLLNWTTSTTGHIVVFDPVRFVNAQRAAASILSITPSADLTLMLTQVAKQSEAVIQEEAHGAVVIVKQAVVVPENIPDITDAVLKRFGLPTTNVPTITTGAGALALESIAPSDSAFSSGKLREDYRVELDNTTKELSKQADKEKKQRNLMP